MAFFLCKISCMRSSSVMMVSNEGRQSGFLCQHSRSSLKQIRHELKINNWMMNKYFPYLPENFHFSPKKHVGKDSWQPNIIIFFFLNTTMKLQTYMSEEL